MKQAIAIVEPNLELSQENTAQGFQELLTRFQAELDIAESSKRTYARQLRQFSLWLLETGRMSRLNMLTKQDILSYKQELLQQGKSARTVSGYLTPVRQFFGWLEAEKIYPNITQGVKGAKRPKGFAKDVLTKAQIRKALKAIDASSLVGLRDYALFNLLARTGLRTIEVNRAAIADIRQITGQAVLYVQGKGRDSKDEFVVLTEEALQPIEQYLQARREAAGSALDQDAPLFCSHSDRSRGKALATRSIRHIVKALFRVIGIDDKKFTAHSMRHTAITLAVLGGASLHQAQAMARHSSSSTTEQYFHNVNRVQAGAEHSINF